MGTSPRARALALVVACGAIAGCERDPLELQCTPLAQGAVVITELRGAQSGADSYGQWVELLNTTAEPVAMTGGGVRLRRLDGSDELRLVVRAAEVTIPARGYLVLGRALPGQEPAHVDYGYQLDFDGNLYENAAIDVFACDVTLDQVVYRGLPSEGTYSFDGSMEPTATANDDETAWCTDATEGTDPTQLGLPGTPGEANRPCS